MKKLKYPFGAKLNKKGMELMGEAFPDGLVPVLNPISQEIELKDVGHKSVHLVNIYLLKLRDPRGYKKMVEILSKKFLVTPDEMDEHFSEVGLPLRHELVSSVEIDLRFVI